MIGFVLSINVHCQAIIIIIINAIIKTIFSNSVVKSGEPTWDQALKPTPLPLPL